MANAMVAMPGFKPMVVSAPPISSILILKHPFEKNPILKTNHFTTDRLDTNCFDNVEEYLLTLNFTMNRIEPNEV